MALVPFHRPAGRPSRQRKEKQLVLAVLEDAGPGQWRRRTIEWPTLDEDDRGRDRLSDAPGPDQ
jgi:hypothetical protein